MTVSSHLTHVSGLKRNLPGFEEKSKQTASPILAITELAVWVPADPRCHQAAVSREESSVA